MKKNEKGFGVVEILLVIVVVGLLGVAGWMFFNKQRDKDNDNKTTSTQQTAQKSTEQKPTNSDDTAPKKIDTSIHEVDIRLQTEADIAKLPSYTPDSFKTYFTEKLRDNKFYRNNVDDADTITEWRISKISQVNVQGGQVPVDKSGEGHPGGAPAIWVLTPAGTWDQETLNGPVCTSKSGGKIYEEFVPTCYDDAHPDGIKNPNGSIASLNN
jgi:cytoskeletal protein RodZ